MITKYHARYYANILTQRSIGGDIDSLSQSLLNAAVDINPHQIEAALFAFKSPLSKGIILADEVGLGKTIEAGLVLCQYWATGQRKIIIICPASIRKQWGFEMSEKFGIDNEVLDTKNYNDYLRRGQNPFAQKKIIICSYNFAARKMEEIRLQGFDLAVIDEAHKLRNVYKKSSVTAHHIRDALGNVKKLLLTATPFQNSLMELYGLTSVIDENIFGSSKSFRGEYIREENFTDLQLRIAPYYKRTLRRDVKEYINYTKRLPLTQRFDATDLEQELYTGVSEFLRRNDLYAVPSRQKMLTTMIIRKILASSTFALIGTLQTIKNRLEKMLTSGEYKQIDINDLMDEDERDLLNEDEEDSFSVESENDEPIPGQIDRKALLAEIEAIKGFIDIAVRIRYDSKSKALLLALQSAFETLPTIGANRKALIFTESTRTQQYLKEFLEQNGYGGKVITFNGSNTDIASGAIYDKWCAANTYNGKMSNIKAADRRAAIVDYFRDAAEIMIATEAAAEGLNLQFCSLVVNYDLPWNPQRIEQRIGRCHRYGQKSDVVVVNFVNQRNYADMRVFDLLSEKFHLFNDVFGASDEVLGQTDGVDFEKRIWAIYQQCRSEQEISAAFEQLQNELQGEIDSRISEVKDQVLQNFDIEVQERLKLAKEKTSAFINRYEYVFWELTKYILGKRATFDDKMHTFTLNIPVAGCAVEQFHLLSSASENSTPYRLSHPLAQYVITQAQSIDIGQGKLLFSPKETPFNITLPGYLQHASGYMFLSNLDVSTFETEQYSLFVAYTKDGQPISQEDCEKLLLCSGTEAGECDLKSDIISKLNASAEQHRLSKLREIDSRNLTYFHEEEDRIFRWEKDMVGTLEHELDTVKRQILEQERLSRSVQTIEEKLAATKRIDELERLKRRKRNDLSEREDEIAHKRRKMIAELDKRMVKQTTANDVFVVEWEVP